MKKIIAKVFYFFGIIPYYSTNIEGNTTRGYGKLDSNGYWEYSLD